jgi:hypothetical protein
MYAGFWLIGTIHNAPAIDTALEPDMWNYLPLICTLPHEDQFQLCFEQFIFVQNLSHSICSMKELLSHGNLETRAQQ